jgi:DNA (cytosine-5)-methyltransferase 1
VSIGEDNVGALTANMHKGIDASGRTGVAVLTPDRVSKRQNCRRFKGEGEPSFTITAQDRHGVYDGLRIRRLTPIECERLMGVPDNWTSCNGTISDTQRYKMCGNGVVPNCVRMVFENLLLSNIK